MLEKKEVNIGGFCCPPAKIDRLPGVRTTAPSDLRVQAEVGASFPNPNTKAIQQILNNRGAEGWQLAAVSFRADEMLCFWMREV